MRGTAIALPAAMKRYRLIEVGCSRELYAIPDDEEPVRDGRTVARFTMMAPSHQLASTATERTRQLHIAPPTTS